MHCGVDAFALGRVCRVYRASRDICSIEPNSQTSIHNEKKLSKRDLEHTLRIVVHCADCGDVRVPTDDVTLRNCLGDDTWTYRFRCPTCTEITVAPTTKLAALEAVVAHVRLESWHLPTGLDTRPGGPPFSESDLATLRSQLADPNWLESFEARGEPR